MTKDQKDFAKQLHHIIRLYDVLELGVKVHKYSDDQRTKMLDIKRGRYPGSKEAAFMMRDSYLAKLNAIYESKKIAYIPQKVDYQALDKIVLDFYKTLP